MNKVFNMAEPKNNHRVKMELNVNSDEAELIREALSKEHVKLSETFEIKRELEIMREVRRNGGVCGGGVEKTLELWENERNCCASSRYKMKHRTLHATKG